MVHRRPYHLSNVVRINRYSQSLSRRRLHASYNRGNGTHRLASSHRVHRPRCPVCGRVLNLRRVNRTTTLFSCRYCHFKVSLKA